MKKFRVCLLILLLIVLIPSVSEAKDITLIVNNEVISTDVAPFIKDGRTYVPVRFIAENLGLKVDWKMSEFFEGEIEVTLTDPKGRVISIDGRTISSSDGITYNAYDDTYILKNDRTFLPIRYIANALNMNIYWNQDSWTVSLEDNNKREKYQLFLTKYHYDDYQEIETDLYIEFVNGEYKFEGFDLTLAEYLDSIYDELTGEELFGPKGFFGNNYFMMSPERDKIVGISAS